MQDFPCSPGGENFADWATEFFVAARASERLYRKPDGVLLYIDPIRGPRLILTLEEFHGILHSVVNVVRYTRDARRAVVMAWNDARALFTRPEAAELQIVDDVIREPVVVPVGPDYRLVQQEGYDPETRIYYWRPTEVPRLAARDSTKHLTKCFSGVPFATPGDRNNLLAWLAAAVVLDRRLDAPLLTITGNDRGVGKSSTAQAVGIILTGTMCSPVHPHGGEFVKQLSARFSEQQRFIYLDNVVSRRQDRTYRNPDLAKVLTEGYSKRVRILGMSRSVSQNGVLFALTANDCRLDADLATRALVVQLFRDMPAPMIPYVRDYALEFRTEIYGELLALAMRKPDRQHDNPSPQFRFRAWARFVGPRIVPVFGELNLERASELDDDVQDLLAYGQDHLEAEFTAKDLCETVLAGGYGRYAALHERIETKSDRSKEQILAKLLRRNAGRIWYSEDRSEIKLRRYEPRNKKATTYRFVQLKPPEEL